MRRVRRRARDRADRAKLRLRLLLTSGARFRLAAWLITRGLPRRGAPGRRHIVLAPPGAGNIGDQALVEAAVAGTAGPVELIVRHPGDVDLAHLRTAGCDVSTTVLDGLIYGGLAGRYRDLRRLARRLRDAHAVAIVGADIMDGNYNLPASIARSQVAAFCAARGTPTRVVGFSWSDAPEPLAVRELRRATARGVQAFARDPLSLSRLERDGVPATLAPDVVFCATERDERGAAALLSELDVDRPYALINASALVAANVDQVPAYLAMLDVLRSHGIRPLLIPHVARPTGDDRDAIAEIVARADASPPVIDRILSPATVRALCARAELVVTGRMHLGVMALRMGVPPVIISTQGKVEGLLAQFELEASCVAPDATIRTELPRVVGEILADRPRFAQRISRHLPEVVAGAWKNFGGVWSTSPEGLSAGDPARPSPSS